MKFTRDNSKVKAFSVGGIKVTGAYICTINKAYVHKKKGTLSESIFLDMTTSKGQYCNTYICYKSKLGLDTDKNGKPLSGIVQINDLMVLLDLSELEHKKQKVKIYDFSLRQDVEVDKAAFPDLIGQEIGCVFEVVNELKQVPNPDNPGGEWIDDPEETYVDKPYFRQFFHPETGQSAVEFLNDEKPAQIERYLNLLLEDKHIIKQATNQPNAPVNDALPFTNDDLEDIPF